MHSYWAEKVRNGVHQGSTSLKSAAENCLFHFWATARGFLSTAVDDSHSRCDSSLSCVVFDSHLLLCEVLVGVFESGFGSNLGSNQGSESGFDFFLQCYLI